MSLCPALARGTSDSPSSDGKNLLGDLDDSSSMLLGYCDDWLQKPMIHPLPGKADQKQRGELSYAYLRLPACSDVLARPRCHHGLRSGLAYPTWLCRLCSLYTDLPHVPVACREARCVLDEWNLFDAHHRWVVSFPNWDSVSVVRPQPLYGAARTLVGALGGSLVHATHART